MHTQGYLVGFKEPPPNEIQVTHTGDFFSCCTEILSSIMKYIKIHRNLPSKVNTENMFSWYKVSTSSDITFDFFHNFNHNSFRSLGETEFENLTTVNPENFEQVVLPIIQKYFTLSDGINKIVTQIEEKYKLNSVFTDKRITSCALIYYRSNVNCKCNYKHLFEKAKIKKDQCNEITFIVQSDVTEFIKDACKILPGCIVFSDEIECVSQNLKLNVETVYRKNSYKYAKNLLATFYILSKCDFRIVDAPNDHKLWLYLYNILRKNTNHSN